MAWTTPRTWNAGETVTSSIMNTHVRDNFNFLFSQLDAIPGSLLARGAVNTTNTASPLVSVIAGTLAADGDAVVVEWDEVVSAGNVDAQLAVNGVNKGFNGHANACGGHHSRVILERTSSTNLSLSWSINDGSAANGSFSHQDVTVSDLASNAFTLQITARANVITKEYIFTVLN
jgi:hypothetical protein